MWERMHMGNPRCPRDSIQRYTRGLDNVPDSLVGGFLVVSRLFLKKATTLAGSLRKLMSTISDAPWACSLGLLSVVQRITDSNTGAERSLRDNLPHIYRWENWGLGGEWVCPNSGRSGARGLSSLESTVVDSYFSISQLCSSMPPNWVQGGLASWWGTLQGGFTSPVRVLRNSVFPEAGGWFWVCGRISWRDLDFLLLSPIVKTLGLSNFPFSANHVVSSRQFPFFLLFYSSFLSSSVLSPDIFHISAFQPPSSY